jgi:pimeloyl-ACP methyl ester carboxylesterase
MMSPETRIVCLHGLLEGPSIWRPLRRRLTRAGIKSVALPLPGHRRDAPKYDEACAILRTGGLVDYIARRIADKTGGAPARIVGHSLGGLLALLVARDHPALVDRVMIVGAPHAGHTGHTGWFDRRLIADIPGFAHTTARVLLGYWLADDLRFEAWIRPILARDEALEYVPHLMRRELQSGCPYAIAEVFCWLRAQKTLESFSTVVPPVTVMVCADDTVVTPQHQMEIVRILPNAAAQVVRCGHLPMLTAPQAFGNAVMLWATLSPPVGVPVPELACA